MLGYATLYADRSLFYQPMVVRFSKWKVEDMIFDIFCDITTMTCRHFPKYGWLNNSDY